MKGFKDNSGKFRPTENKNGVRKPQEQKIKTSGVRLSRNRFHPKGYNTPTFEKKKPEGRWEITKTEYVPAREKFNCMKCGKPMGEANIGFDKKCHECFVEAKAERTMQEMIPRNVIEKYSRKQRNDQPEPILETELSDIFDEVADVDSGKIDFDKLQKSAGDNIKTILKRERMLGKDEHITISEVKTIEETGADEFRRTGHGESGFYQYDFAIWKNEPLKVTSFSGTAYGDISHGDALNMTLELYKRSW